MSIEKRLKQDAARFSTMEPPADLRARLQASLDAVPPLYHGVGAPRPVRRWFAPAVAVLTMCMVFVFMSAMPFDLGTIEDPPGVMMHGEASEDMVDQPLVSSRNLTDSSSLPLDRIGIFSGLALITGFLCVTELKGRPRLLVPALAALTLFLVIALMYMFGTLS